MLTLHLIYIITLYLCYIPIHCIFECPADAEGGWSIGFVFGKDPFNLHGPKIKHNIYNNNSDSDSDSFPYISNPILTCESVNDVPAATFVADPFFYFKDSNVKKDWYIFFEVKNSDKKIQRGQGQIGAAVSTDQVCILIYIVHCIFICIFLYNHLSNYLNNYLYN